MSNGNDFMTPLGTRRMSSYDNLHDINCWLGPFELAYHRPIIVSTGHIFVEIDVETKFA